MTRGGMSAPPPPQPHPPSRRFCPEINHGGNAGLKHAVGVLAPLKENRAQSYATEFDDLRAV